MDIQRSIISTENDGNTTVTRVNKTYQVYRGTSPTTSNRMETMSDFGGDTQTVTRINKHYQVYRGMSPTTSNRMEARLRELEDMLDAERDMRLKFERQSTELQLMVDSLNDRLDEAGGLSSHQVEINRKREFEITKMRKDLENAQNALEMESETMRRRHQQTVAEMSDQIDMLTKQKNKSEKERQNLTIEIDVVTSELENVRQNALADHSRAEGLEAQLARLRAQVDDLTRQLNDSNAHKSRLTQENFELQKALQDLEASSGNLSKLKITLTTQLEDMKRVADDESKVSSHFIKMITCLYVCNYYSHAFAY
ncbi:unc-15 [Bugula neritina]|uniref:Unc-15 n=1 Tax=Bugula neritina TaxID=10212 RepID=A0A7J7K0B8_BUGNE|nr:unc-15 [Bugula neritina]